jgi:hypothetical protein
MGYRERCEAMMFFVRGSDKMLAVVLEVIGTAWEIAVAVARGGKW